MSDSIKEINEGGVNGTGRGVVNTNSEDFRGLRSAVLAHAKKQTPKDRVRYDLIALQFQMEHYVELEAPFDKIEVGQFLKNHLNAINVKNKDFAKFMELEESNLSAIIRGRRKINTDLAFKLGTLFNINPNLWLLIQSKNELMDIEKERSVFYDKYKLEELLRMAR